MKRLIFALLFLPLLISAAEKIVSLSPTVTQMILYLDGVAHKYVDVGWGTNKDP